MQQHKAQPLPVGLCAFQGPVYLRIVARGEAVGLLGSPTPRAGFRWRREAACGGLLMLAGAQGSATEPTQQAGVGDASGGGGSICA